MATLNGGGRGLELTVLHPESRRITYLLLPLEWYEPHASIEG
jgi:hypothetical protein